MFCPSCRSEYRDGIWVCVECGVELVPTLPPGEQASDSELAAAFTTADSSLLPIVKSVLDAAGIPYLVQGEETLGLFPLGRFGVGVSERTLGAIVRVPPSRLEEARELLRGFEEQPDQE
jgi:hypothetical protein